MALIIVTTERAKAEYANEKTYTTDLSNREWHIIEPLLPGAKRLGRKIAYCRRDILNAIFYLNRNGCTWRDLPGDFPPYGIVSHYYHAWRRSGVWQVINDTLRMRLRVTQGRHEQPSAACLDSQSVKTTEIASSRGYDAGKKVKGRKRHILVDTMGLLLIVVVHAASIQDRDGAKLMLAKAGHLTRLTHIWADGAYAGELIHWVKTACQCLPEIVKRSDKLKGFQVLPRRWVVERTFGWLNRYRRLAKDYERLPESSEAMVQIAMIRLMLARLARKHQVGQQQQPSQSGEATYPLAA
ncbi:MAG: IS5 family transposase [Ktedonobacteraceae bacterium]|nr:IS5 family transposase [Ktedonobacteraceae bacterium]MBO0794216.1 IS5 family transposase [Ktedonobacteraceae bacterium]